ncbi:MAG: hypothetical protein FWC71_00915 [Defluviitaleaceae bacterium]|nr:hypothetical protein [Defluviitaleaceae bacterium]
MRKITLAILILGLGLSLMMPVYANSTTSSVREPWQVAMHNALDWMQAASPDGPQVGGIIGEWSVIALVHAGRIDMGDAWLQSWLDELSGDTSRALRRWTDYQRVVLALDALGLDATDFAGRNFAQPFWRFVPVSSRAVMNRTIMADIYALRALNTVGQSSSLFFAHLMHVQRADGSWSLNPAQPSSAFDIDTTAMAVRALAPFYLQGNSRAVHAVGRAMPWLHAQTFNNAESTAQMIVALVGLGAAYAEYAAYYVNHLMQWYDPALGGFIREGFSGRVNALTTVQAAYALAVYYQFMANMNVSSAR